jgi:hypothetical protein
MQAGRNLIGQRRWLLVALAVGALIGVPTAATQAVAPDLAGEGFFAADFAFIGGPQDPAYVGSIRIVSRVCNADGSGSITFVAEGRARGPYPGTFREAATVTFAQERVTRAFAVFSIASPTGYVLGTKTFDAGRLSFSRCTNRPSGSERFTNASWAGDYRAVIRTPTTTCLDRGWYGADITEGEVTLPAGRAEQASFSEAFRTDGQPPVCEQEDDDDDDDDD